MPGDSWARAVPAGGYEHELGWATGPRPWPGVFNDLVVTRWSSPKKTLSVGWGGREKPSSSMMSPSRTICGGKGGAVPAWRSCSLQHLPPSL